jgi:acyl carrier protein
MTDPRAAVLERFVREELLLDPEVTLTPRTRLLSEGLVDSLGAVRLAAFIEETFRVRFDDSDIRAGEVETIADILAVVDARRRADGA